MNELSIPAKIAAHRAMSRAEKRANKETVQKKRACTKTRLLAHSLDCSLITKAPGAQRKREPQILLDRIAGKAAKPEDERPEHELEKMSHAQVLGFMCESIMGMSQESRSIIAEALLCAQRGIAFDPRIIDPSFNENEALNAENGLPSLQPSPKEDIFTQMTLTFIDRKTWSDLRADARKDQAVSCMMLLMLSAVGRDEIRLRPRHGGKFTPPRRRRLDFQKRPYADHESRVNMI